MKKFILFLVLFIIIFNGCYNDEKVSSETDLSDLTSLVIIDAKNSGPTCDGADGPNDDFPCISAAISTCQANRGGIVYLSGPENSGGNFGWSVNSSVLIPDGCYIKGDGPGATLVKNAIAGNNSPTFIFDGANCGISELSIAPSSNTYQNNWGISSNVSNFKYHLVRNVEIRDFRGNNGIGCYFDTDSPASIMMYQCDIQNCRNGIKILNGKLDLKQVTIHDFNRPGINGWGINASGNSSANSNIIIADSKIYNIKGCGIFTHEINSIELSAVEIFEINSPNSNTTAPILFGISNGVTMKNLSVHDCTSQSSAVQIYYPGTFPASSVVDIIISDSDFYNLNCSGITFIPYSLSIFQPTPDNENINISGCMFRNLNTTGNGDLWAIGVQATRWHIWQNRIMHSKWVIDGNIFSSINTQNGWSFGIYFEHIQPSQLQPFMVDLYFMKLNIANNTFTDINDSNPNPRSCAIYKSRLYTDFNISGNVIYNSDYGIYFAPKTGSGPFPNPSSNDVFTIDNNIFAEIAQGSTSNPLQFDYNSGHFSGYIYPTTMFTSPGCGVNDIYNYCIGRENVFN